MLVANDRTAALVRAYYDTWQIGMGSFDEGRLRDLLAEDFVYEGPIAGRRPGVESFLIGLGRFASTLKRLRMLQQLYAEGESAAVYDCDLTSPAGTFRFAEFLRVKDDKIQEVKLVFDATQFR
jgi:ketosteroid isomerase-like protein